MQPLGENSMNTPAFLGKLWKMVNDPSTDHLISWSPSGTSFIIQNQAHFWYELLPLYYKHNNMSSFVRQLNMYGFHKLSTVENGTMDADKDEIQFTHPCFVKDRPELMRNIKRKATNSKNVIESNQKQDELSKILNDVKQLRGRQVSVDNKISAMRKENALLWREVALLRQKHIKQQKIVNKLIQFLVTLVQPARMTVGVKRGYQLMLNESPTKKDKSTAKKNTVQEGPTIHELDSELELPSTVYETEPVILSPTSTNSQQVEVNSPIQTQWLNEENADDPDTYTETGFDMHTDSPDSIYLDDSDLVDSNIIDSLDPERLNIKSLTSNGSKNNEKFFLNPSGQDALLSNLMNTTNNTKTKHNNDSVGASTSEKSLLSHANSNMAIATLNKNVRDLSKSVPSTSNSYNEGLSSHVEATQTELDQLKDMLNGYNSFVDANALLGELSKTSQNPSPFYLFQEDSPPTYDLNGREGENNESLVESGDPLVSGSELAPYGTNFDFTELFDDDLDEADHKDILPTVEPSSTVNTPLVTREELVFPKPSSN